MMAALFLTAVNTLILSLKNHTTRNIQAIAVDSGNVDLQISREGMRPVYLNVLIVEVQVMDNVMANGLLHLIPVTNILSGLSVTGLPTSNVELNVTQIFLHMNVVRMPTVTSVMEDTVHLCSNVSTLDLANAP